MYELLRFPPVMCELWFDSHDSTKVTNYMNGVKAFIQFYRKTDDATTLLGNTIVNMLSIAYSSDLFCMFSAMFIGNDSNVMSEDEIETL